MATHSSVLEDLAEVGGAGRACCGARGEEDLVELERSSGVPAHPRVQAGGRIDHDLAVRSGPAGALMPGLLLGACCWAPCCHVGASMTERSAVPSRPAPPTDSSGAARGYGVLTIILR